MSTSPSILVADVGYGNNKAVWGAPENGKSWREICFRSVAPRVTQDVTVTGFGGSDRTIVTVNDGRYAVGPHADRLLGGQLALRQDYIETPEYEALICGAWHYYLRDQPTVEPMVDLLVLGLPVSGFAKQRRRLHAIGSQLRQIPLPEHHLPHSPVESRVLNARARQVLVLPQPLGALVLAMEDPKHGEQLARGGLILIIDPGYSTFDWLVSDGATPRMDASGAFNGGVSRLLRAVSRQVSQDHGIEAPELPRIEEALREGVLNTGVRRIDMAPYAKVLEHEAELVVNGFMQRFVPGELEIKWILLTGGGANYFLRALQKRLPEYHIQVLPESVMSNARGFYLAGREFLE